MTDPASKPDLAVVKDPVVSVSFRDYVRAPGMSDTTRLLRVTADRGVDRHIRVDRLEADAIGIRAYKDDTVKRYPWGVVLETNNVPEYDLGDAFERLSEALLKGRK